MIYFTRHHHDKPALMLNLYCDKLRSMKEKILDG